MRTFNYSAIKEQKWDSDVLGLIAAIYKEAGKQELYLKQRPEELEKLVEIAKIQSTEASNAIEGIVTTSTRIRQLVEEKTTPRNRDEQEIAGYRDVLSIIHESFDAIPITQNYILQLHKILYSHMFGTKDIIKIESEEEAETIDLDVLGLVARTATVGIVRGGKIVEKKQPTLPEHVVNIIKCVNPRCVTTTEPAVQMFHLVHSDRQEYRCDYCDEEAKF